MNPCKSKMVKAKTLSVGDKCRLTPCGSWWTVNVVHEFSIQLVDRSGTKTRFVMANETVYIDAE